MKKVALYILLAASNLEGINANASSKYLPSAPVAISTDLGSYRMCENRLGKLISSDCGFEFDIGPVIPKSLDIGMVKSYTLIVSYVSSCQFSDQSSFYLKYEGKKYRIEASGTGTLEIASGGTPFFSVGLVTSGSHIAAISTVDTPCALNIKSSFLLPNFAEMQSRLNFINYKYEYLLQLSRFLNATGDAKASSIVRDLMGEKTEEARMSCLKLAEKYLGLYAEYKDSMNESTYSKLHDFIDLTLDLDFTSVLGTSGSLCEDDKDIAKVPFIGAFAEARDNYLWFLNITSYLECSGLGEGCQNSSEDGNFISEEFTALARELGVYRNILEKVLDLLQDDRDRQWEALLGELITLQEKIGI